ENVTTDNLTPGNFYTFYISAVVGDSFVEGYRTAISTYMEPGAPKDLNILNKTTSSVTLSWNPPDGNVDSYLIQILGNSTFNITVSSSIVTVGDLNPGNYYTFIVTSVVGKTNVQGIGSAISTNTKPGKVYNLTTLNITTNSVSLSWQPPEGNTSLYVIQILGNTDFIRKGTSNFTTINNLIPGNNYIFLVSALVGEMTVMGDSTNISTYTRPEKVKNLTIANVTISSVLLSWEPPEGCSSSYLIQIQGNSTISIKVDSIFFSIEDLTPGNYYTFLVSALIGENNFQGNIVAISTYTKPGAVQNLTALYISTSSVSLSWKPPEGNASSYLIQIQGNATFNMIVTLNFIAIRNLISGQNYTFLISALVGEPYLQGRISSLSIIILPEKIRNLIAYNITTSSVSLSWQPPEGYSNAYRIQIQENRTFLMEVTSCFITIEGLTPGNYYTFLVSSLTGETYIQGNSTAIAVNIEPGEVKDLTIYNITTTSMSLNWHPPDGNFSYFLIQILGNSTFNRNVTSYFTIVDGLIPGNYYTLLVTAIAGESDKKGQSANISNYARPSSVILKDVFKVGINSIY
ncbi:hypothetical protein XENTR_v10014388, partial [Xenopus tropicalis]